MSARRQARQRDVTEAVAGAGGVPAALRVGRLVEVWADPAVLVDWTCSDLRARLSAIRRYNSAREWWLESAGMHDLMRAQDLLPCGAPWCLEHLTYIGQAQRVVRPVDEIVDARLACADVRRAEVPALHRDALELITEAMRHLRLPLSSS